MSTTLKMLVEKAHFYYDAMEKNRSSLLSYIGMAGSKIHVLEQLVEQYNDEPKYIYAARNPEHTADQVVAEIIYLDLTQGFPVNPKDATPMKVSVTDVDGGGIIQLMLKILDICAQVQLGDLSIARARRNIAPLIKPYKDKMAQADAEFEFLTLANALLDEMEHQLRAEKEEQQRLQQEEKLAREKEITTLSNKYFLEVAVAATALDVLHQEIIALNNDGENLYEEAGADTDHYKATIKDLQTESESILFRYKEGVAKLESQSRDYALILEKLDQTQAELRRIDQVKLDLELNLIESKDLTKIQDMERVALVKMFDDSNQAKCDLQKETAMLHLKLQEQEKLVARTRDMLASTETLLMSTQATMSQLQQDLKTSQDQLQAAVADKAQIAPQVAELDEQLAQRDAELSMRDLTIKELTAKVKELTAEAVKLRAAKKEALEGEQRANKISGKANDQIAKYLQTIAEGQFTIQQLTHDIDVLKEQVFELAVDQKTTAEEPDTKPVARKPALLSMGSKDDAERIKDGYLNGTSATASQNPHATFSTKKTTSTKQLRLSSKPQIVPVATPTTPGRRP
jgi:hypothetical protein